MSLKLKVAFIYQKEYFDYHFDEAVCTDIFDVKRVFITPHSSLEYYKPLVDFNADINIFFRGEYIGDNILTKLKGLKVAISTEPFPKVIERRFNYTLDSLERFKFFLSVFSKKYDYVFHYDQSSESFLKGQGIALSGYFALPIAHNTYKPSIEIMPRWDIGFIGRSTPHRENLLAQLKTRFNVIHIAHGLSGPEILEYINLSKINLNLHAEPEISWEPRVQLLLACGALVMTEPLSPNTFLEAGKHYIEINSKEALLAKCTDILNNYQDYENIKNNGRERVCEVLTSYQNFNNFINNILDKKYPKHSFNKNRLDLKTLRICKEYNGFEYLLAEVIPNYLM